MPLGIEIAVTNFDGMKEFEFGHAVIIPFAVLLILRKNVPKAFVIQTSFCQNLRAGKYALENLCYTRLMPPSFALLILERISIAAAPGCIGRMGWESEKPAPRWRPARNSIARHGRKVLAAGLLRALGLVLLLIAMILL